MTGAMILPNATADVALLWESARSGYLSVRMRLFVCVHHARGRDLRVDDRGGQVDVTQKLGHHFDGHSVVVAVGAEAVTQHVGMVLFRGKPLARRHLLEDAPHAAHVQAFH